MQNITMDTIIRVNAKGGTQEGAVKDFYNTDDFESQEEFMSFIHDALDTGHAFVKDTKKNDFHERVERNADFIRGKESVNQDLHDERYGTNPDDIVKDVKLSARSYSDAERIMDRLMTVYNINEDLIAMSKKGKEITITVEEVHYKIFNKIKMEFMLKTINRAVNNFTRDTVENLGTTAGIVAETLVVPTLQLTAKTAVNTTNAAIKAGTRVASYAATELVDGAVKTFTSIATDPETARLKGTIAESASRIKKLLNKKGKSWGAGFGVTVG